MSGAAVLVISASDFLWFADQAVGEMASIVGELGDRTANRRPDLAGANSPYVILTHCLGVMEYWGGFMVAGRPIHRDRDAEFRAEGPAADLIQRAAEARRQLAADVSGAEPQAPPRNPPDPEDATVPYGRTQGGVLLHILQELTQHLGQMELTRDILLDSR